MRPRTSTGPGRLAGVLVVSVISLKGGVGKTSVTLGLAGAAWVLYPLQAFVLARIGLWHPRTDLPVVVASTAAAIGVAFTVDWSRALAWH